MRALTIDCLNPVQAHAALTGKVWPALKSMLIAGHRMEVEVRIKEDDRTLQQNKFYWSACLTEISQQARIGGEKYTADAWHQLFKRQFLGYEIKRATVAGSKRKKVTRTLKSTKGLKVRPMSIYLDKVQAFAAGELGVHFSVPNWREFGGETVDQDTGEINSIQL